MKARVLSILLAGSALSLVVNTASADRPTKDVQVFQLSMVIPAGTAWNSPVRFGEVCAFDVAINFDDRFLTWDYGDRSKFDNEFNDTFTNLATGFSFFDTAKYSIQFDHESGTAKHSGIFWKTFVGNDIVVLDVGSFSQNWNLPFPQPLENLQGVHDVNSLPFGTLSYCDWLQGIFPVPR